MASLEQLREQMKWSNYRRFLRIEDRRSGQLVPFEPNSVQRRIRAEIVSQLQANQPVRLIILKSRRMGVSTIIQATFAHFAFATATRFRAVTGAHLDESSTYLHGMTEQMYDSLPQPLQKVKRTGIRGKHLAFNDGASLRTFTAGGGAGVGRGTGTRAVHASEVAYWSPDAAGTLLSLRQIVPEEPETFFILESTANGVGDTFHEEWQRACDGRSAYTPLFFAWHEFEDYTKALDVPLGDLDDDELALRSIGVSEAQLNWRRFTIENNCAGSLAMFHQEYPATPEEAFLSSGRPYFENLSRVTTVDPKHGQGEIAGTPARGGEIKFLRSASGPVTIWDAPKAGHRYVIGADVAGSTILSQHSARPTGTKTDAYCAYCVDVSTGQTVASLYGRGWTENQYAERLAALGRLFNDAEIAVEKAFGYGVATVTLLRDRYSYPHQWRALDQDSTQTLDDGSEYGFPMTSTTRPLVLADLSEALRARPDAFRDAALLGEMRTFVWNDRGRPEADTGAHDDRVMAMAITQHVRNMRATKPLRIVTTEAQKRAKAKQELKSIVNERPR